MAWFTTAETCAKFLDRAAYIRANNLLRHPQMGKMGCVIPYGNANKLCNGEMAVLTTVLVDLNDQEGAFAALKACISASFL